MMMNGDAVRVVQRQHQQIDEHEREQRAPRPSPPTVSRKVSLLTAGRGHAR